MTEINNRYEFVMLFDVENGNPNGDPDAGNAPRMDVETGYGYITDVCLKRKIRNYVELVKGDEAPYKILIKSDRALNDKFKEAHEAVETQRGEKVKDHKAKSAVDDARQWMCKQYFDVRTFGAVMSTGDDPCGIVRGPVQLNFAKSQSPINIDELTITRQAITTVKDFNNKNTEMGQKHIIPYALYRGEGYISAALGQKVGLTEDDLEVLFDALVNLFEHDHSAARGKMSMRKLYIFKHDSVLGNAPAHTLFDTITITPKTEIPRRFTDYDITVASHLPEGVSLIEKL
ncbi:type I-C CRISPR-associated protein Cas7/Csd2 [Peptoniphilus equinus]|uniref:Type I-C CRISPR-associated protein Cas7/Csd2 n=1 Tax=Peptoniphilus equinus TaxID=3016343 RepID=A0ABY7QT06_9FIRM|nr:type I-C CRISPR-associated protein Cas7/Csd2 [Peptoniphilus equinus]WBW49925.1 type I-C CRISPR-associated protein Cas7/Csd2 [Peptoniphilus equinus]